jgi:hypothetical protein
MTDMTKIPSEEERLADEVSEALRAVNAYLRSDSQAAIFRRFNAAMAELRRTGYSSKAEIEHCDGYFQIKVSVNRSGGS